MNTVVQKLNNGIFKINFKISANIKLFAFEKVGVKFVLSSN